MPLERVGAAGVAAVSLPEWTAAVRTRRWSGRPPSVTLTKRLDKRFGSIYDGHRGELISCGSVTIRMIISPRLSTPSPTQFGTESSRRGGPTRAAGDDGVC